MPDSLRKSERFTRIWSRSGSDIILFDKICVARVQFHDGTFVGLRRKSPSNPEGCIMKIVAEDLGLRGRPLAIEASAETAQQGTPGFLARPSETRELVVVWLQKRCLSVANEGQQAH